MCKYNYDFILTTNKYLRLGIPAYYLYNLYDVRKEISSIADPHATMSEKAKMLSLLYESYTPAYWYFEIVETTRRLALTAVLSVIGTGASSQIVLGMLTSFVYICLYTSCQPYKNAQNSIMASVGQSQIYLTFFGALIMQNNLLGSGWDTILGVVLIVINLGVLIIAFRGELNDYFDRKNQETVVDAMLQSINTQANVTTNPIVAIDKNEIDLNEIGIQLNDINNHEVNEHTKDVLIELQMESARLQAHMIQLNNKIAAFNLENH